MADSQTSDPSGPRVPRAGSASEQLREVSFPLAVRGYERTAVDAFVNAVRALVADLEAAQTREGVVQKALDEVGVETAGILQRAHETADEITSRARADAEEHLQQAESEAERVRRAADEYSEQVVVDTRLLWEDRQRLIEDIRQLADEVLATADDAIERVKMPEPLAAAESDPEPTTGEAPMSGPVGVPAMAPDEPHADEPDGEFALGAVDEEQRADDTGAYGLGEVEAEPPQGDTGAYEPRGEGDPYEPGAFEEDSLEADTVRYRLGAVESDGPPRDAPPPVYDESGHTVELEALPGGAGEGSGEPEESEQGRGWDRERD